MRFPSFLLLGLLVPAVAVATPSGEAPVPKSFPIAFGARGGAGYDVIGDALGWNAGVNALGALGVGHYEIAVDGFFHGFDITKTVGPNQEHEAASTRIVAARVNYLFNYQRGVVAPYFALGVGILGAGLTYRDEQRPSGSNGAYTVNSSFDAFSFGNLVNLGLGLTLPLGFDLRIEVPVILMYSGASRSVAIPIVAGLIFRL